MTGTPLRDRPRICFVADEPNWAFSLVAQALMRRLSDRFQFQLIHRHTENPVLRDDAFDLLYVFFWGDSCYRAFAIDPRKIIKEVASHRWAEGTRYGPFSPHELCERYLSDCRIVTTPSERLWEMLRKERSEVFHCPNGVDVNFFRPVERQGQRLRIGWVGNPQDECKGLTDILIPACRGRFDFLHSDGKRNHREIAALYRSVDVIAIASTAESQPLPLMEGMASGCFPVTTDVGVVPELVRPGVNGIVVDRSVESFREAFQWCAEHLNYIRRAGAFNAELIASERSWDLRAERFAEIFDYALGRNAGISPGPAGIPDAKGIPESGGRSAAGDRVTPRQRLSGAGLPLRIALLIGECSAAAGIDGSLAAAAKGFSELGHEVELFAVVDEPFASLDVAAGCVFELRPADRNDVLRRMLAPRLLPAALRSGLVLDFFRRADAERQLRSAAAVAAALEEREGQRPFDLVVSEGAIVAGLFVTPSRRRPHVLRLGRDVALRGGGEGPGPSEGWRGRALRMAVRRADRVYASTPDSLETLRHRCGIAGPTLAASTWTGCRGEERLVLELAGFPFGRG